MVLERQHFSSIKMTRYQQESQAVSSLYKKFIQLAFGHMQIIVPVFSHFQYQILHTHMHTHCTPHKTWQRFIRLAKTRYPCFNKKNSTFRKIPTVESEWESSRLTIVHLLSHVDWILSLITLNKRYCDLMSDNLHFNLHYTRLFFIKKFTVLICSPVKIFNGENST